MIKQFLNEAGINIGDSILVHSSYRVLKNKFGISAEKLIEELKGIITADGSIVMPTFTYCFKRKDNTHEIFDRVDSPSKTGYLTEVFRRSDGVERTLSPTHSFAIWGAIKNWSDYEKNPESPLGKNSLLGSLLNNDGKIFMAGCGFESFTYGHFLENVAPVPWKDISPWDYMGVLPVGVSTESETPLSELPGCSKGFLSFEQYLLDQKIISGKSFNGLPYYSMEISKLHDIGNSYFKAHHDKLICKRGTCKACDTRRNKLKSKGVVI